jgi:hypothetical protein
MSPKIEYYILYALYSASYMYLFEELDSPALSALGVRSRKLSKGLNGESWDG